MSGSTGDREVEARWSEFELQLAAQLARMDDVDEADLLILELPGFDDEAPGTAPYVQFAASEEGTVLHTEVSGNAYLEPQFVLGQGACEAMRSSGWAGADDDEKNWFRDDPLGAVPEVAGRVVAALRDRFGVTHPDLLTYRAWGPAAAGADQLGLCASGAVPVDTVDLPVRRHAEGAAESLGTGEAEVHEPESRDDLLVLVGRVLRETCGEVMVDDDGDFVLVHLGQPVFVRVLPDQPAVQVFTRVVHGVRSRRGAAVEVALLNRDEVWMKWILRETSIWQSAVVPAMPFAESHLVVMLELFLHAMETTRDDLALRTGGEVA